MDKYQGLRELPFPVIAQALGVDMSKFKSRKSGSEWSGPCPVHNGKRSNTAFSYASNGAWHCFSCNEKGKGAIDLVMKVRNVGFQAAVDLLKGHHAEAPQAIQNGRESSGGGREEIPGARDTNPLFQGTYEKFQVRPSPWLNARGLTQETLDRFGTFEYHNPARRSAYNGSVLIRIARYSDGACVGYLSRNVGEVTPEKPKYRFPEGLQKGLELFGAWQVKEDHKLPIRIVYLVESPFAVMKFWQMGLPAVSPFGWSLSDAQLDIITEMAKGIIALPDVDKAEAFAPFAHQLSKRIWIRCPAMPDGVTDPEYLSPEQIKALT